MAELNLSNIFALIIGIDKYESRDSLEGCVSDAKSVSRYLTDTLHVPEDHLLCLLDKQATRKGILDAFRSHLTMNDKIQHSDPIIVYFSGHGDQQKAPDEWHSSDGNMELIIPVDTSWNSTVDYHPNKDYKHGIPDRTLGALIYELHLRKGDNITMIFDCCHSGSTTRGESAPPRYSHDSNAPLIPPNLDEDLIRSTAFLQSVPGEQITVARRAFSRFQSSSQASSLETHVLLAACKNTELAQEIKNPDPQNESRSGLFTYALLKALRECDLPTTSYSSLMRNVQKHAANVHSIQVEMFGENKIQPQTPQCEGRKLDRLLFRTQFALSKGMIQLDRDPMDNSFHIKAGSASGIQKGTELGVYLGDMSDVAQPIAQLVATNVTATKSILTFPETQSIVDIPLFAYVVVTKYAGYSVRILVDEQLKLLSGWQEVASEIQSQGIDISWSKLGEPADLVLLLTEKGVEVQRSDPSLVQMDPRAIVLENGLGTKALVWKLIAIIRFHFHLQRKNPNSPIKSQVGMKLIELKDKPGRSLNNKQYIPDSAKPDDMFDGCLSAGKIARLDSNPNKRYGLQLTNTSNWPLFAWVWYFDFEDYSIESLYDPPGSYGNGPLSNDGRILPVGYGDAGVEPLRVESSTFSRRETGVFMVFLSSTWVDISHMNQGSIYEPESEPGVRGNGKGEPTELESNVWDMLLVGVEITR